MYDVMFLRATIASTSARTSGSEVGNGPAPCCSASGRPVCGPVAVQVETLERWRDRDVDAVPVVDRPLGEHAVEVALDVVGAPRDQRARVVRMRLPRAVRILHPHEEDAPVAVDVLAMKPVLGLLARVRPHARATEAPVGEPGLGAVRIDAGDDVERARVDRVAHACVVGVEEVIEKVQRGGRSRELHRVDLGVDEHGRLLLGRPRLRVRHRAEPDVAALVGVPDRLERERAWMLRGPRLERLGQLGVGVEAVELDAHRARA